MWEWSLTTDDCVHRAMYYNRWLCPQSCALQQMTVSTQLCAFTNDCVHRAMYYNRWLCPLLALGYQPTSYKRWHCPQGYVLQKMTVSTMHWAMDSKPVLSDRSISLSSKIWLMHSLVTSISSMLVNHGPSQQSSKEEYEPWKWVSWWFEPSQPQRITSGLNTNFTLSPSYSFHKSS